MLLFSRDLLKDPSGPKPFESRQFLNLTHTNINQPSAVAYIYIKTVNSVTSPENTKDDNGKPPTIFHEDECISPIKK